MKFSSLILSENSTSRSGSPSNIQGLGNYHYMFDLLIYFSLLLFLHTFNIFCLRKEKSTNVQVCMCCVHVYV